MIDLATLEGVMIGAAAVLAVVGLVHERHAVQRHAAVLKAVNDRHEDVNLLTHSVAEALERIDKTDAEVDKIKQFINYKED